MPIGGSAGGDGIKRGALSSLAAQISTSVTRSGGSEAPAASLASKNESGAGDAVSGFMRLSTSKEKPSTKEVDYNNEKAEIVLPKADFVFGKALIEKPIETPEPEVNDVASNNDITPVSTIVEEVKPLFQKPATSELELCESGKEGENVLCSLVCKLYSFDRNNWIERGRGVIKLIAFDDDINKLRITMHCSGTMKVLLNAHLTRGTYMRMKTYKSATFFLPDNENITNSDEPLKVWLISTPYVKDLEVFVLTSNGKASSLPEVEDKAPADIIKQTRSSTTNKRHFSEADMVAEDSSTKMPKEEADD